MSDKAMSYDLISGTFWDFRLDNVLLDRHAG